MSRTWAGCSCFSPAAFFLFAAGNRPRFIFVPVCRAVPVLRHPFPFCRPAPVFGHPFRNGGGDSCISGIGPGSAASVPVFRLRFRHSVPISVFQHKFRRAPCANSGSSSSFPGHAVPIPVLGHRFPGATIIPNLSKYRQ